MTSGHIYELQYNYIDNGTVTIGNKTKHYINFMHMSMHTLYFHVFSLVLIIHSARNKFLVASGLFYSY